MFDPNPKTRFSNKDTGPPEDDDGFLQFRPHNNNNQETDDDSGVCSPPLWKNSPSPNPSPSHPLISHYCLSPNSRTKAIARGQRELMEMVRNMPESSYELSLKDLVEHHHNNSGVSKIAGPKVQNIGKNQILQKRSVFAKVKRQESKRNGSFEEKGLFLKMGFLPFNWRSKKMKRFGDSNIGSGKVISTDIKTERDWWKKKFSCSSDSDSSGFSSNSGGGSSSSRSYGGGGSSVWSSGGSQRKKHGFLTGCWPFSQSRSNKSID